MMEYKGYLAGPISYDPDEKTFSGIVAGLRDVIHFEGTNADELEASFKGGIDDYLALCAEEGQPPEKAYSGQVLLRTNPDLHRKAAMRAAAEGMSLSEWISQQIKAA
jgi:predicted HicB family RNase H-like nuclease